MSGGPAVLGLDPEEARLRLISAGYPEPCIVVSGRRREGRLRVIRQRMTEGRVELVVSFFKELRMSLD